MSDSIQNLAQRGEVIQSSKRILIAHAGHFNTLSILFFFPVFFFLVVYPYFHLAFFHPDFSFSVLFQPEKFHFSLTISPFEILLPLICSLVVLLLFVCGVATITHSAIKSYYDQPISLVSSIKSIPGSYFPILSTVIASSTIFVSFTLIFSCIELFVIRIIFTSDHQQLSWLILPLIVLIPTLILFRVRFSLAYVVAVVESKYGFETLRRSVYLLKRATWEALLSMVFYVILMGAFLVCGYNYLITTDAGKCLNWMGVIIQFFVSSLVALVLKNNLVMYVVVYMYCKDLNGKKLPLEGGEEFADQYVALPLDDEKKNEDAGLV